MGGALSMLLLSCCSAARLAAAVMAAAVAVAVMAAVMAPRPKLALRSKGVGV